ncbi:uncharacterized protein C8A04DRAFT_13415 [Dichotomopilus funicola]|uniref:Rhodopsin domain-containing protein n=1 Tax=Dichotomopilus funicola TaxID=1934379 RepID=A0AAN6V0L0_9PEZI|nr:hypothetical protein C8A04DRAFT_13415 [Dichotomopilus funicola]
MRLPPPEVLASWPHPNLIDPETRGKVLPIVELTMLSIALICLILRIYGRIRYTGRTGLDDWLMVGGALCDTALTVTVVIAFQRFGWDMHVWDLTPYNIIAGRKISFATQAAFVPSSCLTRLSILVGFLRIAPKNSTFRKCTYGMIVFVIVFTISFFIILFTQCIPTSSYWNLMYYERDCLDEGQTLMAQGVLAAVTDFGIWMLPLPSLFHTKLPWKKKTGLITLFGFGFVAVAAACLRTYWIHYVVEETYDVTWYGFHLWMWTAVEIHLGIICGCAPWLKSFFNFWRRGKMKPVTDFTGPGTHNTYRTTPTARMSGGSSLMESTLVKADEVERIPNEGAKVKEMEWVRDRYHYPPEYVDIENGSNGSSDISAFELTPQSLPPDTPGLAM